MNNLDLSKPLEPITIGITGLTPMLAVSATLITGLSTGVICLSILVLTSVTVACFRRFIPVRLKLIYLLLITSTWVTIIDLALQACLYPVREQLGIYIFILAMNTSLLYYLEESAPDNGGLRGVKESGLAALKTGLVVTLSFTVIGLAREVTAMGGILTDINLLAQVDEFNSIQPVYIFNTGLNLFGATAGAFIMFGLLLSAVSYCHSKRQQETVPS